MGLIKTYIRPDGEEFVEVEPGFFALKKGLEEFPNNIHTQWKEQLLIDDGFALKEKIEITKLWIEAWPECIYYLPSSSTGYKIMVTECPIEGINCRLVKEELCF